MKLRSSLIGYIGLLVFGCAQSDAPTRSAIPQPLQIIDHEALVTEDLPARVWGKAILADRGWSQPNSFNVMAWEWELTGGTVSRSNSYCTFFNHGGPHVDAPNHVGLAGGLDSYPIEVFSGPVKAFDVSAFAIGRTVDAEFFSKQEIDISPAPTETDVKVTWQTFQDARYAFQFEYPPKWKVENQQGTIRVLVLPDENSDEVITIDTGVNLIVIGISYCGAYPQDPRCEVLKTNTGSSVTIDWGVDGKANAMFSSQDATYGVSFTLHEINSNTKVIFRKLLSTFQFIE